jgi:hypothetical protein
VIFPGAEARGSSFTKQIGSIGQFGPKRRGSVSKSADFGEPNFTIFQNAMVKRRFTQGLGVDKTRNLFMRQLNLQRRPAEFLV